MAGRPSRIYLEVRPGFAARRRLAAGRSEEIFDEERVQSEIAGGYLAAIDELRRRGDLIEVVDGERSVAEVHADVVDRVTSVL